MFLLDRDKAILEEAILEMLVGCVLGAMNLQLWAGSQEIHSFLRGGCKPLDQTLFASR